MLQQKLEGQMWLIAERISARLDLFLTIYVCTYVRTYVRGTYLPEYVTLRNVDRNVVGFLPAS